MIISQRLLKRIEACKDQCLLFKQTFPGGKVKVTGANLQKAHTAGLNIAWLLENLHVDNGYAFADFACRVVAPFALRQAGLLEQASKLEALSPIIDRETADIARDDARAAMDNARAAAMAAARVAEAAGTAEAAWAAGTAEAAARAAARAARDAGAAAWDAEVAVRAARDAGDADALPFWDMLAELINKFVKES